MKPAWQSCGVSLARPKVLQSTGEPCGGGHRGAYCPSSPPAVRAAGRDIPDRPHTAPICVSVQGAVQSPQVVDTTNIEIAEALQCALWERPLPPPTAEVVRSGARILCFHDGAAPSSRGGIRPSCRLKTPQADLGMAICHGHSAGTGARSCCHSRQLSTRRTEAAGKNTSLRLPICTWLGQESSVPCHVAQAHCFSHPYRACTRCAWRRVEHKIRDVMRQWSCTRRRGADSRPNVPEILLM